MAGYGRPRLDDRRDAMVSIRTWPRLKAALEEMAAEKGMSVARYLEDLLIEKAKLEGRWS